MIQSLTQQGQHLVLIPVVWKVDQWVWSIRLDRCNDRYDWLLSLSPTGPELLMWWVVVQCDITFPKEEGYYCPLYQSVHYLTWNFSLELLLGFCWNLEISYIWYMKMWIFTNFILRSTLIQYRSYEGCWPPIFVQVEIYWNSVYKSAVITW